MDTIIKQDFDGKLVKFSFGMKAMEICCEELECGISEINNILSDDKTLLRVIPIYLWAGNYAYEYLHDSDKLPTKKDIEKLINANFSEAFDVYTRSLLGVKPEELKKMVEDVQEKEAERKEEKKSRSTSKKSKK